MHRKQFLCDCIVKFKVWQYSWGIFEFSEIRVGKTHIGTVGSWSSRAHTARMNTPETRSDKHTGPSLRHRTHPGNPGLNTDSLGGRDREYGHVCIAFVFGWYIVLANTPTMHKNNSGLAETTLVQQSACVCSDVICRRQLTETKKTKMGRTGQLIWSGT